MSVFSGEQYPKAMRDHRERKRQEAEERQAAVKPERTRRFRRNMRAKAEVGG